MEDYTSITIYYEDNNEVVSKHYDNIPLEKVKEIMEILKEYKKKENAEIE